MKSRNHRRMTAALSQTASLMFVVGLLGCQKPEKSVAEAPGPKVEGDKVTFASGSPQTASLVVQAAQVRTLAITHLTGRLYWDDAATVRVFTPVAGRVTAIRADLGDPVEAGMPLAEIDSPDFGQALANARTSVGNLAMADRAFSRSRELLAHGAAAQKDVEAAEAAYVASLAEKNRAEAVLANYGGTTEATNSVYLLRSPLTGVLVEKAINPGQEVRPDLMLANAPNLFVPLFVVSDPTKLWLQLDVAESDLTSLQAGQQLHIYSRAFPDLVFEGVVSKVGGLMDPSTRTVKVRGVVNNPDKLLKAEMYVTVDVERDLTKTAQAGVEIPAKAVFMKGNDSFLFIEQAPGEYQRKHVVLGTEKDGRVPVFEGVKIGEKVVTEGALLLQAVVEPAS